MREGLEALWRRQLAWLSMAMPTIYGRKLEELNGDDKVELTKEYLLSLHSELTEVLNNIPWKKHRFIGRSNRDALLEEMVDVQKFLWGLMMIWEVNPSELAHAFNRKSDIVEQRFQQDHVLPSQVANKDIVIVDIDGVVADWKNGFDLWVERHHPDLENGEWDKHVDPGLRERLKNEMHGSGGMLHLQCLPGTAGIKLLQEKGYEIIWLTARPINSHPRLVGDTIEWLKKNNFPTDYIFYSDLNKHTFVADKFPVAAGLFDDKAEIVAHARELGIPAYQVKGSVLDSVDQFLKEEWRGANEN